MKQEVYITFSPDRSTDITCRPSFSAVSSLLDSQANVAASPPPFFCKRKQRWSKINQKTRIEENQNNAVSDTMSLSWGSLSTLTTESVRVRPNLASIQQASFPAVPVAGPTAMQIAELANCSPTVTETISSTHCTDPQRDGQADWAQVALVNAGIVDPPHPSTYRVQRSLTVFIWPMLLPLLLLHLQL